MVIVQPEQARPIAGQHPIAGGRQAIMGRQTDGSGIDPVDAIYDTFERDAGMSGNSGRCTSLARRANGSLVAAFAEASTGFGQTVRAALAAEPARNWRLSSMA